MTIFYVVAVLVPALLVPFLLPRVALAAHKKAMLDRPNERKKQKHAVLLMGGLVIVATILTTLLILNALYGLNELFDILCAMGLLFALGMVDDAVDVGFRFKFLVQGVIIFLMFFAGSYRIDDLGGLLGIDVLPFWASLVASLIYGYIYINGTNFADGIDGLCSGLGVLYGASMAYWNIVHGYTANAFLSLAIAGALSSFFVFNVFSEKFKMYMGDSGSLVIGVFAYISTCPPPHFSLEHALLADQYCMSFFFSVFAVIVIDPIRVVICRVANRKSPFEPDRTHLHHMLVDSGYSHLLATGIILLINVLLIVLWYLTASSGMSIELQYAIVIVAAVVLVCMPYFLLDYAKKHPSKGFERYLAHIQRVSEKSDNFKLHLMSAIDRRNYKVIKAIHDAEKYAAQQEAAGEESVKEEDTNE